MNLFRIALLASLSVLCAFSQTQVQDTLYLQPGVLWDGQITISWPSFTTADGHIIPAGSTVAVVHSGALLVYLWPTVGATPAVAYSASYLTTSGTNRGLQWQDPPWNVPASPSVVALGDIRPRSGSLANGMLSGAGAPSNLIGANGDIYLRTDTACIYGPKANSAWPGSCIALIGPPGIMLYGAGAPSAGIGIDGQFYLDTAASCLYGPKTSTWPGSCQSLVGPPGGVNSFNGRSGDITPQSGDYAAFFEAPLSFSPPLSRAGNIVSCPTCGALNSVTSVAGRIGDVLLTQSDIAGLVSDLGLKAPVLSPVFQGQVTIPDFTLARHSHLNAAGGGTLDASSIATGTLSITRIPTGSTSSTVSPGNHTHDNLYATAAGKADGYYCVQISGGLPTLLPVSSGLCGTSGGGGGGLLWTSLTNSQWTSLTNSQWTSLGN